MHQSLLRMKLGKAARSLRACRHISTRKMKIGVAVFPKCRLIPRWTTVNKMPICKNSERRIQSQWLAKALSNHNSYLKSIICKAFLELSFPESSRKSSHRQFKILQELKSNRERSNMASKVKPTLESRLRAVLKITRINKFRKYMCTRRIIDQTPIQPLNNLA